MPNGKENTEKKETSAHNEEDDFQFGKKSTDGDGTGTNGDNEGDAGEKGKGASGKEGAEGDTAGKGKEGGDQGAGDGGKGDSKGDEGKGEGTERKAGEGEGSSEGKGDEGAGEGEGKGAGEGKDGTGEGEGGEGKAGEGKGGEGKENIDFFEDESGKGEGKAADTFDVKGFASEFEIDTEDPVELKKQLSEKIENAKQEVKLDGYSADAQGIIKHLNKNEGTIEDFFQNENIASLQGVIGLKPEQKVLYVRHNELTKAGMSSDEATTKAGEEIDELGTREIKDAASKIDEDANKLIKEEISTIIGDREKIVSQKSEKTKVENKQEIESMKNYVNAQDDFMGIELTPKAKQNIVRDIDSGVFDEVANKNPASSKLSAYMLTKFGKKIIENYSAVASEQNRKGHNEATDKQTDALHKSQGSAQGKGTGKQGDQEGGKQNFGSWSDESMFEDETAT